MPTPPRTVLITGATGGLGLALARVYAAQDVRLVLLGRRVPEDLDPTLFEPSVYCRADLIHKDAPNVVDDFLRANGIEQLDLLIHNAGVGYYGTIERQSAAGLREIVDVNLRAPVALTHRLLPRLTGGHGRIVFISSVAAALPAPNYVVYAATKSALEGFARNLRAELRGDVVVQIIAPGAIRTEMHAKSGAPLAELGAHRFPAADVVARQVVAVINRGTADATIGSGNRWLSRAGRYVPGLVDRFGRAAPTMKHCAITGAADGIGKALAFAFGRAGYTITGIDRDADLMARTADDLASAGIMATFITADLAIAHDLDQIVAGLRTGPPIDVMIHNAGINAVGRFGRTDVRDQHAVLDVNLVAPLLLTAALLRDDTIAPGASFVFMSSLSRFVGYPGAAVYGATKDGLASYARGLAVARPDLHVVTVYPGPTRTAHARRYSPDNRREGRRMPPEQLASYIFEAVQARRRTLIPGRGNKLFAAIGRLFPPLTTWLMRKTLLEKLP